MLVKLLPKHIANGLGGHCRYCPWALAIADAIMLAAKPGERLTVNYLEVGTTTTHIAFTDKPGDYVMFDNPKPMTDFICKFDSRMPRSNADGIEPMELELPLEARGDIRKPYEPHNEVIAVLTPSKEIPF